MPFHEWHIKSTTKASPGNEYGGIAATGPQLGDDRVQDINNYIKRGMLWEAFGSEKQVVLLIDEIERQISNFRTICCVNSTEWNFTSTRRRRP